MGERLSTWLSEAPGTGLRFAFIGPLVGGLIWVSLFLLGELTRASLSFSWDHALQSAVVLTLCSYVFGVVPAFLTGLLVAPCRDRLTPRAWCAAAGLAGMAVATLSPLLIGRLPGSGAAWLTTLASQFIFMGVPGLIGGFASAWYMSGEDRRQFRR